MKLNLEALGKRIRKAREKRGLSQNSFAEYIKISTPYVSYIENGKRGISLDRFVEIANALRVHPDWLLADQLKQSALAADYEITMLLADCTEYEKLVIIDTITAIKASLREHQKTARASSHESIV